MVGPDHPSVAIWDADAEHLVLWPFLFGKQMVWLFILLSGFALYWSEESRIGRGRASTPIGVYAWRRAMRILPTYYITFALGIAVTLGLAGWLLTPSPSLDTSTPVTWQGVSAHIFLVHNLSPEWVYQGNPPLWSIAVEAQLYLLFPVLLLLSRRLPVYVSALVLVGLIYGLNQLVDFPLFSLVQWFMAGAVLAHFVRRRKTRARVFLPIAALATLVGMARIPLLNRGMLEEAVWLVAAACLIMGLAHLENGGWNLASRGPLLWLGERSYSLYAIHFPILLIVWSVIGRTTMDRPWLILVTSLAGIAVSLLAATLLFRAVERPSLRASRHIPWAAAAREAAGAAEPN